MKRFLNAPIITLLILVLCVNVSVLFAQESNKIKLVVNGEAQTKEAAVTQALRSAIEMSFGTFVSANTSILNDEIVKDEIATVSSGNIKSYTEIASVSTENGYYVTLEATVSLDKLISYAKGHGSSCEFAGQTFAMNMKMKELNRQNELKVIAHLKEQVSLIAKDIFDFKIEAKDPIMAGNGYKIPLKISVFSNDAANVFFDLVTKTLSSISLTEGELEEYKRVNIPYFRVTIADVIWDGPGNSVEYAYHYYVRNKEVKDRVIEILQIPFQNVYLKLQYTDGVAEQQLMFKDIKSVNKTEVEPYIDGFKYRSKSVPNSITEKGPYPSGGYFISFPLLKKMPVRYSVRAVEQIDYWTHRTNDKSSPYSTIHRINPALNTEQANEIFDIYFNRTQGAPLYTFEINYFVPSADLMNLTGFLIAK